MRNSLQAYTELSATLSTGGSLIPLFESPTYKLYPAYMGPNDYILITNLMH